MRAHFDGPSEPALYVSSGTSSARHAASTGATMRHPSTAESPAHRQRGVSVEDAREHLAVGQQLAVAEEGVELALLELVGVARAVHVELERHLVGGEEDAQDVRMLGPREPCGHPVGRA